MKYTRYYHTGEQQQPTARGPSITDVKNVYLHVNVGEGEHDLAQAVQGSRANGRGHVAVPLLRDLGVDLRGAWQFAAKSAFDETHFDQPYMITININNNNNNNHADKVGDAMDTTPCR